MTGYRAPISGSMPPVVKNLLILNVLLFLGTVALEAAGINLTRLLGLHFPASDYFNPAQFVTHMFMHGGFTHLFFNMFALWMFGKILETVWGPKRFLIYYFVTGIGAAALHTLVNWWSLSSAADAIIAFNNTPSPDSFLILLKRHFPEVKNAYLQFIDNWTLDPNSSMYANQAIHDLNAMLQVKIDIPTVGASGAVFGVLLAFGMLFPNTEIFLLFPPIPLKAKYLVIGYGLIELYGGVMQQPGDNVAHFAHLGGMLFGFFLIKYWNKHRNTFY